MARIGRFVVPDLPHHVTQRGNRREKVSFSDDNALSRDLLHEACGREGGGGGGLLPDAEPRPSDPDPADAGGSRAGARRGASALFGLTQPGCG